MAEVDGERDEVADDVVGRLMASARARTNEPDPRRRGGRRRPARFGARAGFPVNVSQRTIAAAVAVLAGIAGVAIVGPWRSGTSDALAPDPAPPAVAPSNRSAAPPSTEAPIATTAPVVDVVPVAWRPRCRRAPALDAAAIEAVVCSIDAMTSLEVRRYGDRAALEKAYARLARGLARGGADTRARCAVGQPEDRAWRASSRGPIRGRYACSRDAAGAHVAWSDVAQLVISRMNRRDGNLAAAYAWWTRAPL